jgi:hypothetical protein
MRDKNVLYGFFRYKYSMNIIENLMQPQLKWPNTFNIQTDLIIRKCQMSITYWMNVAL